MPTTDLLLYESPPPGKIRALTWFSATLLAFCILASRFVMEHMTRDSHSPALAPLSWRLAFAGAIIGLGAAFFGGMLVYLRCYTTRLFRVAGTDSVRIETLRLFGCHERVLAGNRISSTIYHRGKLDLVRTPSVDAPWLWVRVHGGRGFLLDIQGEFFDTDALARVFPLNDTVPITGDLDKLED